MDKEKVIKGMESLYDRILDAAKRDSIAMLDALVIENALSLLKEQEAVVLCKDCEHYDKKTGRCALRHVHGCAETWFCADGKRKESR